jgi:hypothetical protein
MFHVVAKRLPGEAGAQEGVYAVYSERPRGGGVLGTLRSIVKDDLSPSSFPWGMLGAAFLAAIAVGLLLMFVETDRPLKRLVREALLIGKGERKIFTEELHSGKYGSIARSVNLALEKLAREKGQRRDLGALYSTEDTGSEQAVRPLPPSGPLGTPATPVEPPAAVGLRHRPVAVAPRRHPQLRLQGGRPAPAALGRVAAQRIDAGERAAVDLASEGGGAPGGPPPGSASPRPRGRCRVPRRCRRRSAPHASRRSTGRWPPAPQPPPLPPPPGPSPLSNLDDDILGGREETPVESPFGPMVPRSAASSGLAVTSAPESLAVDSLAAIVRQQSTPEGESAYFRQVYEDFIELKQKCGESTDSLTFDKFLVNSRRIGTS